MAALGHARGVPAVRVASRLQLAATFFPCSLTSSDRDGQYRRRRSGPARPPPAMVADVRVVIRRHFPAVGPDGGIRTVEDIALRRRRSRELRGPERVERALAEDVLPLVRHRFDRGAVAAASREICAYVSAACADPCLARSGVHVLVLVDTFASLGVVLRAAPPPPCKLITTTSGGAMKSFTLTRAADPCMQLEKGMPPAKKEARRPSVGVIGDGQRKPVVEERFKGWLPW